MDKEIIECLLVILNSRWFTDPSGGHLVRFLGKLQMDWLL